MTTKQFARARDSQSPHQSFTEIRRKVVPAHLKRESSLTRFDIGSIPLPSSVPSSPKSSGNPPDGVIIDQARVRDDQVFVWTLESTLCWHQPMDIEAMA